MSSISTERQRVQNTTNWPQYKEHRAYLADLFPAIRYSGQSKLPLACGIKHELIGANVGLSADDIKHFLRAYTFGPKYLRALKAGAVRVDLSGDAEGCVTAEEAAHAALCLRTHYADRERRRLLRDVNAARHERAAEPTYAYRFAREAA